MNAGAPQTWFVAGTITLMITGAGHALLALRDTVRPTFFTPIDPSVRPALEGTGIRLRRMSPGGTGAAPSMWRVWLGIHIAVGLGIFAFGLLCLLIVNYDLTLIERIDAIRPLTIAFSGALLALSLRFFFYGPAIATGLATACFTSPPCSRHEDGRAGDRLIMSRYPPD